MMRYDDEYDYDVTLTTAQFSSLFPNIVKDKNDKFYYLENDVLQNLIFTEYAYEVNHIYAFIKQKVLNKSIKLVVNQGSARCKIF